MKVFATRKEIEHYYRLRGIESPGFVPTMGALHDGHLSLVRRSKEECTITAVSIFVNPTQFNDPSDLKGYPRTLDTDLEMLAGVLGEHDFVFAPPVGEIYPKPDIRVFDFGHLGEVMEGKFRPGHFNGVAQVVSILFDIIKPSKAFFGLKDFQQLAIIRELARRSYKHIEIVPCPIVREDDGLAMSSRNRRLLPRHRKVAGIIFRTLSEASGMARLTSLKKTSEFVKTNIEREKDFRVEYFEIVDDVTLTPIKEGKEASSERRYFGCIAVRAGEVRLIDNLEFRLP